MGTFLPPKDKWKRYKYYLSRDIEGLFKLSVESLELPTGSCSEDFEDLIVSGVLYTDNEPLHVEVRCVLPPKKSEWDTLMTFPVQYNSLPRNTQLVLTLWRVDEAANEVPVGGTTLLLFDNYGVLKPGAQRLKVWEGVEGDGSVDSSTIGDLPQPPDARQEQFRLEKLLEKHEHNEIEQVDWLDKLAMKQIRSNAASLASYSPCYDLYMRVLLPYTDYPVLFEERTDPQSTAAQALQSSNVAALDSATLAKDVDAARSNQLSSPWTARKNVVSDPGQALAVCEEYSHPVEAKYQKLKRSMISGVADRTIKPNRMEKDRLNKFIFSTERQVEKDEKELMLKFRYTLVDNKKALTKFLSIIDWGDEQETKQATDLLGEWVDVDVEDALKLLSADFTNEKVRGYAIQRLVRADREELLLYLLQLVQALRYEPGLLATLSTRQQKREEKARASMRLSMEAAGAAAEAAAEVAAAAGELTNDMLDDSVDEGAPVAAAAAAAVATPSNATEEENKGGAGRLHYFWPITVHVCAPHHTHHHTHLHMHTPFYSCMLLYAAPSPPVCWSRWRGGEHEPSRLPHPSQ
jgi:phosphatidylinositol 3-kinase